MSERTEHNPPITGCFGSWLRAVATYELFPEFSTRIRRLFCKPLSVLVLAALAALLCGVFLNAQGFVLFGSVAAVIALGVLWPWLSLPGVCGSISFERRRCDEGEQVKVGLVLYNRLPWTAYGLTVWSGLSDQAAHGQEEQASVAIAAAPGRRATRCHWPFKPERRGVYPLATPALRCGFPFGLWECRRALSVESPLVVWPRTYPVGPVPMVSGDRQIEGSVSHTRVGSNGDVLGARPYRRGDSPRRIHWSQSARHDRLIVCELEANARPQVQLVLDADPTVHVGHGPNGSHEWAIRIVASLAKGWLAAGVEVGATWHRHAIPVASGLKQLTVLLDALARLADTSGPSLAETLNGPACRRFTDGLQVIVTTDVGLNRAKDGPVEEHQRWVVLQVEGFDGTGAQRAAEPVHLPITPWLVIGSPEHVPALLRGVWKDVR